MQTSLPQFYRSKLDSAGRMLIPVDMRSALGLKSGDEAILEMSDDGLRIRSVALAIEIAQRKVAKYKAKRKGKSIVDELIRERRAEARKE